MFKLLFCDCSKSINFDKTKIGFIYFLFLLVHHNYVFIPYVLQRALFVIEALSRCAIPDILSHLDLVLEELTTLREASHSTIKTKATKVRECSILQPILYTPRIPYCYTALCVACVMVC